MPALPLDCPDRASNPRARYQEHHRDQRDDDDGGGNDSYDDRGFPQGTPLGCKGGRKLGYLVAAARRLGASTCSAVLFKYF